MLLFYGLLLFQMHLMNTSAAYYTTRLHEQKEDAQLLLWGLIELTQRLFFLLSIMAQRNPIQVNITTK